MGQGSYSASSSAASSTGATQFGNVTIPGIGGSIGISTITLALIIGGLVAFWFFFLRKK